MISHVRMPPDGGGRNMSSSVPGGIFASATPRSRHRADARDVGPILGGGGSGVPHWAGPDAAGGRSSNAGSEWTHTRGALRGAVRDGSGPAPTASARSPPAAKPGAFAHFLKHGPGAGASPSQGELLMAAKAQRQAARRPAGPHTPPPPDAFLELLDEATSRDEEDAGYVAQLIELEEQQSLIAAAAAQLASEQQLSPSEEQQLCQQMLARVHVQLAELQAKLSSPRAPLPTSARGAAAGAAAGAVPTGHARTPPAGGSLEGIFRTDGVAREAPLSKARGAYHPSHEQSVGPHAAGDGLAAAGQRAGAGCSAVDPKHRVEHYAPSRPERDLHAHSMVVFDAHNPGGLYPHSTSYHRGKPPGY